MQTIQTTVSAVQVYRMGAEVTRKGNVMLAKGTNTVKIIGLSMSADLNTVKLFFPAGTGLSDIRFGQGPDEKAEERPGDPVRDEISALQKQKEVRELQITLWKENGQLQRNHNADLKEVEEYITRLPERIGTLNDEIRSIDKKIVKLEKDLKEAERLENLPYVTAVLEVPQEGNYPCEVRYHDHGAGWNPVYEIHTNAADPVQLKSRARITQDSDEEWKDVTVSLLTSMPAAGGELPEADPVWLQFRPEIAARHAKMSSNNMMMGMSMAMAVEDSAAAEETMEMPVLGASMKRAETKSAEVSSEETMTEYALPGTKTIPSGSEGTMADLQMFELPAEYELIAVPKKDVRAYLAAKIRTSELPADIRGTAAVYLNGVYSGETSITPDLTKETLDVPLGKAEGIQVSRMEKKRRTSDALIRNQRTTEYEYELKLTNNRSTEVTLTVQDDLPVSQEKTIVVEAKNLSGAEKNDDGILTWKPVLGPKETKVLNLAYNVSWPKDKKIMETVKQTRKYCPSCGTPVSAHEAFCPECGARL